ncbi:asparaginase [Candidatus Woesebacteria bacterium]|nr:asparaginase [Candidatus Woesebacteria bacterium]
MIKPDIVRNIGIVYAGGTISSLATKGGYRIGGIKVDLIHELQNHLAKPLSNIIIASSSFAYTGLSENITTTHQSLIARKVEEGLRGGSHGVVVTHGTDSMEHTARYLQSNFGEKLVTKNQKIIITGANNDLADPRTDAWENLEFALKSAVSMQEAGVYIAFHNILIPADTVVKEPYDGVQMNYVDSGSQRFNELSAKQHTKVELLLEQIERLLPSDRYPHAVIEYRVNRVVNNHDELLKQITPKTKSILFTLYHSGTANTENSRISVSRLTKKLRQDKGIISFGVTENGEPVDLHLYETSVKLREAGMVPLYNMLRPVAKEKLIRLSHLPSPQIILQMLTKVGSEIDESQIEHADIRTLLKLYNK